VNWYWKSVIADLSLSFFPVLTGAGKIPAVAETDVEELWEYIAKENNDAADSFILHIEK